VTDCVYPAVCSEDGQCSAGAGASADEGSGCSIGAARARHERVPFAIALVALSAFWRSRCRRRA
jgi:hypothetical protein